MDDDLKWIRFALCGISRERAAALCGVTLRTYTRWESGLSRPPAAAVMLLRIAAGGDLGAISSAWAGWRINGPHIISPEGLLFGFGEIRALPLHYALIAALRNAADKADGRAPLPHGAPGDQVNNPPG